MIKTREELMKQLQAILGDNTSDDALHLVEDLSDTLDEHAKSNSDDTDWKARYEENDKAWAKKYRDRFFAPVDENKEQSAKSSASDEGEEKPLTYDNLFTKGDAK